MQRRRLAVLYDRTQAELSDLSAEQEPEKVEALLLELRELRRRQQELQEEISRTAPTVPGLMSVQPLDLVGTFPLPDSQLDRFLLSFALGYPDPVAERELLKAEDRSRLLERTGHYRGLYHVLRGALSPPDGVGPEELGFPALRDRVVREAFREIILATNPTAAGEATAHALAELLGPPAGRTELVFENHHSGLVTTNILPPVQPALFLQLQPQSGVVG